MSATDAIRAATKRRLALAKKLDRFEKELLRELADVDDGEVRAALDYLATVIATHPLKAAAGAE